VPNFKQDLLKPKKKGEALLRCSTRLKKESIRSCCRPEVKNQEETVLSLLSTKEKGRESLFHNAKEKSIFWASWKLNGKKTAAAFSVTTVKGEGEKERGETLPCDD